MTNKFICDQIKVYFKHTEYWGDVHPYNYLEWTSYVRESFFQETVNNFLEVLERPIKMMTTKMSLDIVGKAQFGDLIEARLAVGKIKKVSFDMMIEFFNKKQGSVVATTTHTVVFFNEMTNRFAPIPVEMTIVINEYAS